MQHKKFSQLSTQSRNNFKSEITKQGVNNVSVNNIAKNRNILRIKWIHHIMN